MSIEIIFKDKTLKAKEKSKEISTCLLNYSIHIDDLLSYAEHQKDSVKATCIEAIEFATRQNSAIANEKVLNFVIQTLTETAPRVKWESAKVIANIAHLFSKKLENAVANLLANAEHSGTVVRWNAAYALGEIIKLKSTINTELLPAVEAICHREERNCIKKIYGAAMKKLT